MADKKLGEKLSAPPKGGVHTEKSDELTFISEGLPPIATKVVAKIEKGEYVDFTELLPKKPSMDDPSISELADEGIIVVTQARQVRSQKKPIQDVATWMEAFLTFVTIRNRKHPTFTNDLLSYGALIVRGARDYKGPGWLSYDFQYRRLAAARQNHGDWGKKDVALWNDTVCKPQDSPSYSAGSEPSLEEGKASKRRAPSQSIGGNKRPRISGREKQWKNSVCFPYSYSGKCTRDRCDFLHICYDCGGAHAQIACKKSEPNSIPGPPGM